MSNAEEEVVETPGEAAAVREDDEVPVEEEETTQPVVAAPVRNGMSKTNGRHVVEEEKTAASTRRVNRVPIVAVVAEPASQPWLGKEWPNLRIFMTRLVAAGWSKEPAMFMVSSEPPFVSPDMVVLVGSTRGNGLNMTYAACGLRIWIPSDDARTLTEDDQGSRRIVLALSGRKDGDVNPTRTCMNYVKDVAWNSHIRASIQAAHSALRLGRVQHAANVHKQIESLKLKDVELKGSVGLLRAHILLEKQSTDKSIETGQ